MINTNPKKINFQSTYLKFAVAVIIAILLLIPMQMIENLVKERALVRNQVVNDINSKWGRKQEISGPILRVPYKVYYGNGSNFKIQYASFLPENLSIVADLKPETRYRSIYKVAVYESALKINGNFNKLDFETLGIKPENVIWEDAHISYQIPDMRGITGKLKLNWNGQLCEVQPGSKSPELFKSGINSKVLLNPNSNHKFSLDISIKGSSEFSFIPIGKSTSIKLKSTWDTPSFYGEFLPDSHNITDNGFIAEWNIMQLNRDFPQQWKKSKNINLSKYAFGVKLKIPVDKYLKSMRSAKYAILFILTTFISLFAIELLTKRKTSIVFYLLLGFALVLFYSLLLSLSEQMSFNLAYIISATAIISLTSIYSYFTYKKAKISIILAAIWIALYSYLFVILQLEEMALLVGNIGLFIKLAISMFVATKLNKVNNEKEKPQHPDSNKLSILE